MLPLPRLPRNGWPPRWWRGRKRLGRPPGWRIVKSGTGRDRRRLSLWPRQRCANQRAMHRPFFAILIAVDVVDVVHGVRGFRASAFDRRISRGNWILRWILRGGRRRLRRQLRFFAFHHRLLQRLAIAAIRLVVRDAFRRARRDLGVERRWRVGLAPLPRNLGVLVFVLGIARRAARLLDVPADHRDDGMIGQPPLARTVIVKNVTKPRLALLHLGSRRILAGGERNCEGEADISRACPGVSTTPKPPSKRPARPAARSIAACVSPPPTAPGSPA